MPQVTIKLKNQIPAWVSECSYNTRQASLPPSHQSYAIYEMVEGIYGAFYNAKDNDSRELFRLPVKFDNFE